MNNIGALQIGECVGTWNRSTQKDGSASDETRGEKRTPEKRMVETWMTDGPINVKRWIK
jgi:hypothetical protein